MTKKAKQHTVYKLANGKRVPGTTTITGVLNKPALVPWANKLGLQGIKVSEYVNDLADIGTLAHAMVIASLEGKEADTSDYSAKQISSAENSALSFFDWKKGKELEPIIMEKPLVSETYKFGGTADCFCKLDGVRTLIDFKTGKGIFPEMPTQVIAYMQLLKENGYEPEQGMILRIGRTEDEGFETRQVKNTVLNWKMFLHCLGVYETRKQIKKEA